LCSEEEPTVEAMDTSVDEAEKKMDVRNIDVDSSSLVAVRASILYLNTDVFFGEASMVTLQQRFAISLRDPIHYLVAKERLVVSKNLIK